MRVLVRQGLYLHVCWIGGFDAFRVNSDVNFIIDINTCIVEYDFIKVLRVLQEVIQGFKLGGACLVFNTI